MACHLPARANSAFSLPVFLAPAFAECRSSICISSRRQFTSSCSKSSRQQGRRDMNKKRGVSAIRSTGPRIALSVNKKYPKLPTPRPESERPLDEFPTPKDHGLYGFFNEKRDIVLAGEDEEAHGRSWTYRELMAKSFDDLHALYWMGLKEMNRIATRQLEHNRLNLGFGGIENEERKKTVEETNETIRKVLQDRQNLYSEARMLVLNKRLEDVIGSEEVLEENESVEVDDEIVPPNEVLRDNPSQKHPSQESRSVNQ